MNRRFAAFLLIGGLTVCLVAGALWAARELKLTSHWAIQGFAIILVAVVLGSLVQLIRSRPHQGLSVLWCRRFSAAADPAGSRNRWLEKILVQAAHRLALPITLRDRSVGLSRSVADPLEVPLTLALVFVGMGGFIALAFVLPASFFRNWSGFLFTIAAYGSVWVVIFVLLNWLQTSLATYRGRPEQLRRKLRGAMTKGRTRGDTFVVRCADDDWRDCVEAVLAEASLVILDATAATGNIEWELRRALETLGAERILLLEETDDDRAVERAAARAPIRQDAENVPACTVLRFGKRWVGDERQAFLHRETADGRRGELGPRAREIAAALRNWMLASQAASVR